MTNFQKRIISSVILIPIVLFFIIKGSFFFNFFIFICFLFTAFEWRQIANKKKYFLPGLLLLFFSFYSVYLIRVNENLVVFIFIILTCVATDIGGYLFGKVFKGPKLTKISPNKTYAGMFGGFFLSTIFIYLFLLNTYFLGLGTNFKFGVREFIFVILISSASQIGDLIISYFKRISKVKNTGKIIPGHGGLLDRIDGMIFAFPISYLIIYIY